MRHSEGREVGVGDVDGAECEEVRHREHRVRAQAGAGSQLAAQQHLHHISCVITIIIVIVSVTFLVLARQPALPPSPAPALPRGRGLAWPLLLASGLEKAQPAPADTSASMEKVRITHRHPYLPGG